MLTIFLGERGSRLQEAVHTVLGRRSTDDLEFVQLDGVRDGIVDLNNACTTISMFGDRRRVYLENAPSVGSRRKQLIEWLAEFMSTNNSACDLAISVYLDLGDRGMTTRAKAFEALAQHGATIQRFKPLTSAEATRYAKSVARNLGVQLSSAAAERLIELVTANADMIKSEIEKLAAYLGFSGEIQENDVDIAAAAIGEHSRWDYINAVADHNADRALSILDDMLAMETAPALIMSDITTNLRKLAMARQIVVGGGNARDVAQAARVPQFRAQALARRANFMSDRLIAAMYAEVIRTDIALKSGRTDDKAQLEILTARISADPRRSRG